MSTATPRDATRMLGPDSAKSSEPRSTATWSARHQEASPAHQHPLAQAVSSASCRSIDSHTSFISSDGAMSSSSALSRTRRGGRATGSAAADYEDWVAERASHSLISR